MNIEPQNKSERWVLACIKNSKKKSTWISCGIILILSLIYIGVGIYFCFFRDISGQDLNFPISMRFLIGILTIGLGGFSFFLYLIITLIWYERLMFSKIIDRLLASKKNEEKRN